MKTLSFWQFFLICACVITITTATIMICDSKRNSDLDNKTTNYWLFREIQLRKSSSHLACATLCLKDKSCISFMENRNSLICRLYSTRITKMNKLTNAKGFVSYDTCRAEHAHGTLCSSDSDCILANTNCNGYVCQCALGWSYSPGNLTCVRKCNTYGLVFTGTKNYRINATPRETLKDNQYLTADGCATACSLATGFLCLSFSLTSTACELNDITSYDAILNSILIWSFGNSYYQRHCL